MNRQIKIENITERIKFYADIFQEAFKLTANEEASVMITQEIGKDLRQSLIPENKGFQDKPKADTSNQPATEKQLETLRKFHIKFNEGITKQEAMKLIDESFQNRKKKEESYY